MELTNVTDTQRRRFVLSWNAKKPITVLHVIPDAKSLRLIVVTNTV